MRETQRAGDYAKWKWFDRCLSSAIYKLSQSEPAPLPVYSALHETSKRATESGRFRTYVSTTRAKEVATQFMGGFQRGFQSQTPRDELCLHEIDEAFKNQHNLVCCDVSWISKWTDELEILFARSLPQSEATESNDSNLLRDNITLNMHSMSTNTSQRSHTNDAIDNAEMAAFAADSAEPPPARQANYVAIVLTVVLFLVLCWELSKCYRNKKENDKEPGDQGDDDIDVQEKIDLEASHAPAYGMLEIGPPTQREGAAHLSRDDVVFETPKRVLEGQRTDSKDPKMPPPICWT